MPIRIPDIKPPDRPPTNTPIMVAMPWDAVIEKVKGKVKTTAMAMVKPGMAPASNPAMAPTLIRASV